MLRLSPWIFALLAFGLAVDAHADEHDSPRGRGWWGDLDRGHVVDLANVIATPRSFTGRDLTFFCVFRGKDDIFLPQGTVFTRRKFTNLSIWPDGTPLWEQDAYQKGEFPFLYIETSHTQRDELVRMPRFTRIEITGRVRSIVRDRPFIEVTSWRETSHRLGRDVVDAMAWGDIFAGGGKTELAAAKYQEALRVDLPPLYDMAIRKRAGEALRRLGYVEYADAIERGETLGGTEMPAPALAEPTAPGTSAVGFAPPTDPSNTPGFAAPEPETGFASPGAARPGTAAPSVRTDNPFLSDDMPGEPVRRLPGDPMPVRGDARPPTPPVRTAGSKPKRDLPAADNPSLAPNRDPSAASNPFLGDDLPGVPVGAPRGPGLRAPAPQGPAQAPTPAAEVPPDAAEGFPPPMPLPRQLPEAAPSGRSIPRPVLPPSRRPRLVGVR